MQALADDGGHAGPSVPPALPAVPLHVPDVAAHHDATTRSLPLRQDVPGQTLGVCPGSPR